MLGNLEPTFSADTVYVDNHGELKEELSIKCLKLHGALHHNS